VLKLLSSNWRGHLASAIVACPGKTHASFDDPNLVSRAGLVPVMALAERAGLAALVRGHVQIAAGTGVNADLKIGCLVAGMAAGADSIDDMDVLRHGAMGEVFRPAGAPSVGKLPGQRGLAHLRCHLP